MERRWEGGEPGFWETDKGNLKTARLGDLGRQPGDYGKRKRSINHAYLTETFEKNAV